MEQLNSKEFASCVLAEAQRQGKAMNATKLQKIMYICDGTLLASGENVIGEQAKAWPNGPVYPSVFKWYDKNKNEKIEPSGSTKKFIEDKGIDKVIEKAVETFGDRTAGELSAWTHQENSPWRIALARNGEKWNSVITKDDMRLYFGGIMQNARAKEDV